ncbi:MAG: IS701 family transposase, partial [Pseudonocardiaceae bacterium]
LCLIVPCPFAAQRKLHMPVMARLYRSAKSCQGGQRPFKTRHELLSQMLEKLCHWLPERRIRLCADGAYAAEKMLSSLPSQVAFTARVRRDAALYELAPERTNKRGRPREKGARLPALKALGEKARGQLGQVTRYGVTEEVLLHTFVCLWPTVAKKQPLRIVIVRDPHGKEPADYFFTTDVATSVVAVTEEYAGRWGIEEAIRELKQSLGMDEVQSWSSPGVWRQVPFVMIVHSLVVAAYYKALGATVTDGFVPPSFGQMLTRLRFGLWEERIKEALAFEESESKIMADLHAILQTAA